MLKRSIHSVDASLLFFFLLLLVSSCPPHVAVVQSFVLNTSVSCHYQLKATHHNSMILPFRGSTRTTSSITMLSAQRSNTEGPQDHDVTRPDEQEKKKQVESFTARLERMGMKPVRREDMRRKALVPPPTLTPQCQSNGEPTSTSKSKSSPSDARSANLSSQELLSNWLRMNKIEITSVQSLDEFLDHIRMSRARKLDDQFLRQGLENVAESESKEDGITENECWE